MRKGHPVLVLQTASKRDLGTEAHLANIKAGRTLAEIMRTILGPRSMLKMLLDPIGGIVISNDGNAVLREVDVSHPAAKALIDVSRAQDEEVGDGTTSVVVLTGELLAEAEPLILRRFHPTRIVQGLLNACEDCLALLHNICVTMDLSNETRFQEAICSCLNTKFSSSSSQYLCDIAIKATKIVEEDIGDGAKDIDVKKYCKIEKIPGGSVEDSVVLQGVLLNKDVVHAKMRRCIKNPRVVLLDCTLEYKKGESQTKIEITKEEDFEKILQEEEAEIKRMCDDIVAAGCDVVVTEKGISDLAQHFLVKAGISAIRRVKKTDNNRLSRITGATIVTRTDELLCSDVGRGCGLFEVKKLGDEYYTYFVNCDNPKACTVLLRGSSKDSLNEIERNLHDALYVARNIRLNPKLIPGGGAAEVYLAQELRSLAERKGGGLDQCVYKSVASALEVIPRTLIQNGGGNVLETLTQLKSFYNSRDRNDLSLFYGVNGLTGEVEDVFKINAWDTLTVKQQVIKSALETTAMILRIDDILTGHSKKRESEDTARHAENQG